MAELKLELHSPITEEEWDLIIDVDLDHTSSVMFHTKHGKDVEYIKVKHGRWISTKSTLIGYWHKCSECGGLAIPYYNGQDILSPYCPWCGARMDEVDNGK